jgi:hypothetical protein
MTRKERTDSDDTFGHKEGEARIDQLAEFGCTDKEIAAEFKISVEDLQKNFDAQLRSGRLKRCLTLRRQMYYLAKVETNPPSTRFLYEHELPTVEEEQKAADAEIDAELDAMSDEELERLAHGRRNTEEPRLEGPEAGGEAGSGSKEGEGETEIPPRSGYLC